LKCQNAGENEENFREAKWLTCVQIKKKPALTTLHGHNSLGIYLWTWSVKKSRQIGISETLDAKKLMDVLQFEGTSDSNSFGNLTLPEEMRNPSAA
jgi:hypothetical protein